MADPRTIKLSARLTDAYIDYEKNTAVYAFQLVPIDAVAGGVDYSKDLSAIYTESLVEAGVIVYPSTMSYIITVGNNDDFSDVIFSILDHSDDTVYSAYFSLGFLSAGLAVTFTEGDTPPDDGGGDDPSE